MIEKIDNDNKNRHLLSICLHFFDLCQCLNHGLNGLKDFAD